MKKTTLQSEIKVKKQLYKVIITALQSEITTLQSEITALQSEITVK